MYFRPRAIVALILAVAGFPAFADQTATLCLDETISEIELTELDGDVILGLEEILSDIQLTQPSGDLVLAIDDASAGAIRMTAEIGVEVGLLDVMTLVLLLEEVESEDVTVVAAVTDHAHLDHSLLPEQILIDISAWNPPFGNCDALIEIAVKASEQIGLAPWQEIDVVLEVSEYWDEDPI